MQNKQYHTVGTFSKSQRKILEMETELIPLTHMLDFFVILLTDVIIQIKTNYFTGHWKCWHEIITTNMLCLYFIWFDNCLGISTIVDIKYINAHLM